VVVEQLLPVGTVAALGVPLADLAPYLFAAGVVTLLAHSNVAVPGQWLARVVVTPGYHRSHHERGRDGSNFALVLPVIDVLFGTASFEAGARTFGTNAEVPESGFVALLRWGFGLRASSAQPAQRVSTTSPAQNDRALAT
jgi:sterol desaturase/sphingolipid hydroxylase (fatty acid hydroxylase superfamily)